MLGLLGFIINIICLCECMMDDIDVENWDFGMGSWISFRRDIDTYGLSIMGVNNKFKVTYTLYNFGPETAFDITINDNFDKNKFWTSQVYLYIYNNILQQRFYMIYI